MDLQGKSNGQGTNPFYLHESLRTGRKMRAVRRESRVFRALQEVLAVFDEQCDTPVTGAYKGWTARTQ